MNTDQLLFDIPENDSVRATRVIEFPTQHRELEVVELPDIGKTICTHVALQRLCKKFKGFSKHMLYRAIRRGDIEALKPTACSRKDGYASNAHLQVGEASLERFIGRKETEYRLNPGKF